MLRRLQIRGFQKHKFRRIEFDPHVTMFVGPSESGKSCIIRALRWLFYNRPLGDGYVNWYTEGVCEVRAELDGRMVGRVRTKTENLYLLDGQVFRAFGDKVPDEVAEFFNLIEASYQPQQGKGPYLLSESPAEVSRQLNEIVNLEVIDQTLSTLLGSRRTMNSTVGVCENRLRDAEDKLEELDYVTALDDDLRAIEKIEKRRADAHAQAADLRGLCQAIREHHLARETALRAAQAGQAVVDLGTAALAAHDNRVALATTLEEYEAAARTAAAPVPDMTALDEAMMAYVNAKAERVILERLIEEIDEAASSLKTAKAKYDQERSQLEAETGGVCPICEGPLHLQ